MNEIKLISTPTTTNPTATTTDPAGTVVAPAAQPATPAVVGSQPAEGGATAFAAGSANEPVVRRRAPVWVPEGPPDRLDSGEREEYRRLRRATQGTITPAERRLLWAVWLAVAHLDVMAGLEEERATAANPGSNKARGCQWRVRKLDAIIGSLEQDIMGAMRTVAARPVPPVRPVPPSDGSVFAP
jgi:hypothetical protein